MRGKVGIWKWIWMVMGKQGTGLKRCLQINVARKLGRTLLLSVVFPYNNFLDNHPPLQ